MAAYPTLPWAREGFRHERDDGLDPVRASNGVLKVRRLFSAEKSTFSAMHPLTDAQKAVLVAFYSANKLLDMTLTLPTDGLVYTVRFAAAPVYDWETAGRWLARVRLLEV